MAYLGQIYPAYLGQTIVGELQPPDIAPPALDPNSPDYCDVFVDDPDCYGGPYTPPPPATAQPSGTWQEKSPFTLPIQVFEKTIPILVSRPEPVNMPISQSLTLPAMHAMTSAVASTIPNYLWVLGLIGGGLLLMASQKRRKKAS